MTLFVPKLCPSGDTEGPGLNEVRSKGLGQGGQPGVDADQHHKHPRVGQVQELLSRMQQGSSCGGAADCMGKLWLRNAKDKGGSGHLSLPALEYTEAWHSPWHTPVEQIRTVLF